MLESKMQVLQLKRHLIIKLIYEKAENTNPGYKFDLMNSHMRR